LNRVCTWDARGLTGRRRETIGHKDAALPLHLYADEIRAISNEELYWGEENPYTTQRCNRLIQIAAELAALGDTRGADAIEQLYRGDLTHLTPYSGGDAAIFDGDRILLIQRKDDQLWAMPGGAIEVGETPAQGACREAWEETGIEVEATVLSGVYDSRLCGSNLGFHLYHFVFICRPQDAAATPSVSNETLDVGWYDLSELPSLSPGHSRRITDAFRRWSGQLSETVFDRT